MAQDFVLDLQIIRTRAGENLSSGATTAAYQGQREQILGLLNDALATELVCMLRYKRHMFMSGSAGGIAGFSIAAELAKHSAQEQDHAERLAQRIVQLGGEPNFDPRGLAKRSHAEYGVGRTLPEMLSEDLIAERIAIDVYSALIRHVGDKDITTRRLLEDILQQEEEHASELRDLLKQIPSSSAT